MYNRAKELAEIINQSKEIHIVTHNDADGLTAGAIACRALDRLGKSYSIESVKQLDDLVLKRLKDENHERVWFTDLGSSICNNSPDLEKIVSDHHVCDNENNANFHLNPHLFDRDGSVEISGAGVTYLVARQLNKKNMDLSALAVIGALGDLQDRKKCQLIGLNREIISDAEKAGVVQTKTDIQYFGRETKPVYKLLQYASDPLIPGLTGREEACINLLKELNIPLKSNDSWRKWVDLQQKEKQQIISWIVKLLLQKGFGHKLARRIIGEVYILCNEQEGTELHDAKEFATLLNATARYGKADVGINVCLGDRDEWLKQARSLLRGHRHNLVEGMQVAREEGIVKKQYLQYFHAGEGIQDTIVGIVASMLLNSQDVDSTLPLLGFANTDNGDVKVSARGTRELIERGLNLSKALNKAARSVEGVGGGHNIAAGATIPSGTEEGFLEKVEKEIKQQLD